MWSIQPVLTVVLGALLGAENLNAPEASGWLRVPALIAALILVAQGLLDFENARREHTSAREAAAAERAAARLSVEPIPPAPRTFAADSPSGEPVPTSPMLRALRDEETGETVQTQEAPADVEADARLQALEQAERPVTGTTVRESGGAVLAILVLAVWLGLATLSYSTAPASLLGLSLIASFLLFASAWSMLQTRRA